MPGTHLLWVEAPEVAAQAQPGQFITVRCGEGHGHLLRRPLSIHGVKDSSQVALLFSVVGWGTEWLSQRREGQPLDILGPLGNGFSVLPPTRHLLLVAGGIGIAPLAFLAQRALAQELSVTLLLGAPTGDSLYPAHHLPAGARLVTATEDGSQGRKGMVTDLLPEYAPRADQVFACGPVAMYGAIRAQNLERSVQVSLEARMGCGLGACYACSIQTRGGQRRVCQEGPIFELGEVSLESLKT
ncbi:MAG: dihydroorotate dehydrogenase electron transfer subunit [Dehalococcoidia bacterium]